MADATPSSSAQTVAPDRVTVVRARGKRLTKRHRAEGSDPYDDVFLVSSREVEVGGVRTLGALLRALEQRPDEAVIRGRRREPTRAQTLVRRAKNDDPAKGPAGFEPWARCWLGVDLDELPCPPGVDPTQAPEAAVRYALAQLPPWLQGVTVHWQWSASAGVKGWAVLKLHLWFWLDRPVDDVSLRAWARATPYVDPALYESVQLHYTAAPVFEGVADPLRGRRSGLLEGERGDVVTVPESVWGWSAREEAKRRAAREERARLLASRPVGGADALWRSWMGAALAGCRQQLMDSDPGSRHDTALKVAGSLANYVSWGRLPEAEARAVLDLSPIADLPGRDGELDRIWEHAQGRAAASPQPEPVLRGEATPPPPGRHTRPPVPPPGARSAKPPPPPRPTPSPTPEGEAAVEGDGRPVVPHAVFARVLAQVEAANDRKAELTVLMEDGELAEAFELDPEGFDRLLAQLEDLGATARRAGMLRRSMRGRTGTPSRRPPPEGLAVLHPGEGWPDSDNALALRLLAREGTRLRFAARVGWLFHEEGVWRRDEGPVLELACRSAQALREEVEAAWPEHFSLYTREQQRPWSQLWSFARTAENIGRVTAAVGLARVKPEITVQPDDLDRDAWLFNVRNGTLDLRTGEFRAHCPDDLLTRQTPVAYDAEARCPLWERFVADVMGGDPELVAFLQRAAGYTLSGRTSEQCFFLLHGGGSNGKSTFLDTLHHLLGGYARSTNFATFADSGGSRDTRNDVADLFGARYVTAVEPDEGVRLAEGLVKQLTGGDVVKAKYLYHEPFDFRPTFKVFLACNTLPLIRGTDHGLWRRVRLIPFLRQFRTRPDDPADWPEADRSLPDRLRDELPGILNWAVQGALAWQARGLDPPAAVLAATDDYRRSQDVIGLFLEECCLRAPGVFARADALYHAYCDWCEDSNRKPLAKNRFGERIAALPGISPRRTKTARLYDGVGLLATTPGPGGDEG